MSVIRRWMLHSSATVKALMGISIISAVYVIHRGFVAPALKKKRYREAEEWANMIFELEEKGEPTNIVVD